MSKTRVLVISDDFVDQNMGGVGVRNWELAHTLSSKCDVILAIPNQTQLRSDKIQLITYSRETSDLNKIAQTVDVLLLQGFVLHFQPFLADLHLPIAVDLYVPSLLESLVWHDQDNWDSWIPNYEEYLRVQLELIRFGDFFFCASERQRDYWLGWLHAQKRINPHTFRQDPTLKKLINVVSFGLPSEPPNSSSSVLKGKHPGIHATDKVILWSGGLWDWLDPITLIQAMAQLVHQHPEIKLLFMGTHHPNPIVRGMTMPERVINLSQELGLYEKTIFFGKWVPYHERGKYLADADLAVISHSDHIETHFSFRTRLLDCIWAGLPIITTQGDSISDTVVKHKVGMVIPPNDSSAMAEAIIKLINSNAKDTNQRSFDTLRKNLEWNHVAEPLIQFCLDPYFAPDRGLYLTETERMTKDKDAFLEKVIKEKDAFLDQVIRDKDAHLSRVVNDKDTAREQALIDQKTSYENIIQEKDSAREQALLDQKTHYENTIQEKDAAQEQELLNQKVQYEKIVNEKDSQIQKIISEKEALIQKIVSEKDEEILQRDLANQEKDSLILRQQEQLEKYQQMLPFRLYAAFKRMLGKR